MPAAGAAPTRFLREMEEGDGTDLIGIGAFRGGTEELGATCRRATGRSTEESRVAEGGRGRARGGDWMRLTGGIKERREARHGSRIEPAPAAGLGEGD